jgi:branched-chain amino acid aminotransferase
MITRGTGKLGLDPGLAHDPLRVIIVAPLEAPSEALYESGIAAVTYRTQRPSDATTAVGAKIGNYLVAALAMKKAREAGAAEALIVDGRGRVVEGATSNVFAVRQRELLTPATEEGILAGITRARILDVCRERKIKVRFRALPVDQLVGGDEVFVSSSIREVLGVVRIDGADVGEGRPGPVTRELHAAFREKVRQSVA